MDLYKDGKFGMVKGGVTQKSCVCCRERCTFVESQKSCSGQVVLGECSLEGYDTVELMEVSGETSCNGRIDTITRD